MTKRSRRLAEPDHRARRELESRRMADAIASAVPVSLAQPSPSQLDREIDALLARHPGTARHTGTADTMPAHHWVSAVIDEAGVSERDLVEFVTRERLALWRRHGETVSGAADMVRRMVTNGRRDQRADDEVDGLRRLVRAAFKASR